MGSIRVLSDSLINRIAAGEVVERPASVVKELIENALDAGASSIRIALRAGGKERIEVVDDGGGMDRDDALLAIERHATSKLRSAGDLEAIPTLGFRGEALSSIAAVSRFTLETATRDGSGTEVVVHGGTVRSVREVGLPRGTAIRVERLFSNVPARRKFLRATATELAHAVRLVTRYALARPAVRIVLEHEGRDLLRAEPTADPLDRIRQILGEDAARKLLAFDRAAGEGLRVHGHAGRPAEAGPRRDSQHFFVNGRAVQDRLLARAVADAYGNTVPRGRHPAAFLFVEIDPHDVDVNVHPQKSEVRFRDPARVVEAVRGAVASALSAPASIPTHRDLRPSPLDPWPILGEPRAEREEPPSGGARAAVAGAALGSVALADPPAAPRTLLDGMHASVAPAGVRRAVPLAQFRDSYIVAEDLEGLLLVDQHAAHERVLFERFLEAAGRSEVEVQQLLFPVTVELRPDERVVLERETEEFRRLGFEVVPFGGQAVRIDAVPALIGDLDPAFMLRELLGQAARARSAAADVDGVRAAVVTTAACHAAIKVHYRLTATTMQALLDDLFATENPTTCPHGRPAVFRLTLDEIERTFRRR